MTHTGCGKEGESKWEDGISEDDCTDRGMVRGCGQHMRDAQDASTGRSSCWGSKDMWVGMQDVWMGV